MGRNVAVVSAARLAMSAGRSVTGIAMPVYLGLEGFSALQLGELMMAVAATSAVLSVLVGMLSDRIGRRPFLIAFPLISATAALVFAFLRTDGLLVAAAAFGTFGQGAGVGAGTVGPYQGAESALATESTDPRWRNAAFGRVAFAAALGALCGSLLVLLAGSRHPHGAAATVAFRPAFLAAAVVFALAGALGLLVREVHRAKDVADAATSRRRGRLGLAFPQRSRPLLIRLWITNSVNGVAVGMFGPFVTYWFFRRYGATAASLGLLFAIINAATLASALSAAGLARRFGLIRTVVLVRAVQAVLLIPMVLAPTFLAAGAVFLVRMVVQRIGLPLRQSYVLAMADPSERASVAALSTVPSQVALASSPAVAGYLFDQVSLSLPFEIAGLLQLLNAGLYFAFFHRVVPEEEAAVSPAVPGPDPGP